MRRLVVAILTAAVLISTARRSPAVDAPGRIDQLSREVAASVVQWRRDIHAHPELGNRERRTAALVAEQLKAMGVDELKTGIAHHGVAAVIHGRKPGPTVALRADMDALPVQEQTGLAFASQNAGVMHACGHDSHTAMLLGAAKVLVQLRDELPGNVKLIFQPAEEGVPAGEEGGAAMMIREGVLDNPEVKAIFGLHVNPELETGKIGYRDGSVMASVDRFWVTITGRQSHAATPWQGIDPIVASAQVITAIQTIPSRRVDARQPVVVSVGIVRGGQAWNIIPAEVILEGTVRTHNEEVRRHVAAEFARIVERTAAAQGAKAQIDYRNYVPAVWNDPELGKRMRASVARAAGEANLVDTPPAMGGEDFAQYARKVPGYFLFLGIRNEKIGAVHGLHTPKFTIDEQALTLGVRTLALLAFDYLRLEAAR